MTGDEVIHWLRPATTDEKFFCQGQDGTGFIVSTYGLTLRTTDPLENEQVQETLVHLFRRVPTLRLCFRYRKDVLWACDMNRQCINFKALDTGDHLKVQEDLMNHRFSNRDGPLWCARLLQQDSFGGSTSPGLGTAFPHSRCLVLANHHGIADGTTNNRTVDTFLKILNDVIAGNSIDDTEQVDELASGEETAALVAATERKMKEDENLLKQTLEEVRKRRRAEKLIPRAFPQPEDPNYTTKVLSETLNEEATARFFRRCKQEGVTVNSCFASLINGSLVDLVMEAGLRQDTYPIREMHATNMRRYWKGDVSRTLGSHASVLENCSILTHQWRDNFWQRAREHKQQLHMSLQNLEPVKYYLYLYLSNDDKPLDAMVIERTKPESDYNTSNTGNLDLIIPTEGKHVRLVHLLRTAKSYNFRIIFMFHTLRGRLQYSLSYASDILSEQQASRFVELIFRNLKTMI